MADATVAERRSSPAGSAISAVSDPNDGFVSDLEAIETQRAAEIGAARSFPSVLVNVG
jgi:hypothetical protein